MLLTAHPISPRPPRSPPAVAVNTFPLKHLVRAQEDEESVHTAEGPSPPHGDSLLPSWRANNTWRGPYKRGSPLPRHRDSRGALPVTWPLGSSLPPARPLRPSLNPQLAGPRHPSYPTSAQILVAGPPRPLSGISASALVTPCAPKAWRQHPGGDTCCLNPVHGHTMK